MAAGQSTMDEQLRHRQQPCQTDEKCSSPKRISRKNCNVATSTNNNKSSSSSSSSSSKGNKNIVRKRLGCRRTLQDMISYEEEPNDEKGDGDDTLHYNNHNNDNNNNKERHQKSRQQQPPRSLRQPQPQRRLMFTSPRVISSDEDLFPSSNNSLYIESNQGGNKYLIRRDAIDRMGPS